MKVISPGGKLPDLVFDLRESTMNTSRPPPPPSYLKNRCPHEREVFQGIRDTFESLRNVKVVYIVFTWLP